MATMIRYISTLKTLLLRMSSRCRCCCDTPLLSTAEVFYMDVVIEIVCYQQRRPQNYPTDDLRAAPTTTLQTWSSPYLGCLIQNMIESMIGLRNTYLIRYSGSHRTAGEETLGRNYITKQKCDWSGLMQHPHLKSIFENRLGQFESGCILMPAAKL
jgi:hypothetical protein